jgi:hypothetical protein
MHPLMMAALISGGVNALQGKRGSDLLKSTVRDTAIAAALGGMQTPGSADPGISSFAPKGSSSQILPPPPSKTAMMKGALQPELYGTPTPKPGFGSKLESAFSAIEKPFRDPVSGDISKFRVGLGAAGLGGAAYAAGLFDPKPAPDPKYPGYNRFYAADPSMFQPFSGKEIDYSKYPEGSPYSGMQEGGEVMSPDDEMLQFDMQQQSMADGPGIVGYLKERFDESFTRDQTSGKAMRSMMKRSPKETISIEESITAIPMSNKISSDMSRASAVELMQRFEADPDKTAVEVAVMQSNKDRVTVADVQRAKDLLQRMAERVAPEDQPRDRKGIGSLLEETDIRIPKAEDAPAQVQELMDTFRSRASNEPATNQFKKGDLVDVLPSKLKRDENDEKNYKRTSGKMVTDETGKGSGNKDTMLAQLADGEFVTKAKSVLGAGKAMGGKSKAEQRKLGAQFFYKQMADLEKLAEAR